MKPEERAEMVLDFFRMLPGTKNISRTIDCALTPMIRDAITAAIEEEREACRVAAQDEEDRARELQDRRGDYGGDMFRAGVTQGRRQAASLIEARIRARSEGKGSG